MKESHFLLAGAASLVVFAGIAQSAVFQDDFEAYEIGAGIISQTPPVGGWGSEVSAATGFTVQANPGGTGQVLRAQRTPSAVGGYVSARSFTAPQPDTQLVISWDSFRSNAGSTAAVQPLYIGTTFFGDSTILVNDLNQEIRYHDGTGYQNTGVLSGYGGWERFEMVINFGSDNGSGVFNATFDLFFERLDVTNSQGVLARTQLVTDSAFYATGFTDEITNMRWVAGLNPHTLPGENSTVYFDNLSMNVVPEPVGLAAAASLGLLLGRRRRV